MTNPFIINTPQRRREEDDNPFVVRQGGFSSYSDNGWGSTVGGMLDRINSTARVFRYVNATLNPFTMSPFDDGLRKELFDKMVGGRENFKPAATEAIKGMASNVASIFDSDTYKKLGDKAGDYFSRLVSHPINTAIDTADDTAKLIASLPVNIVSTFVVDPFEAITGIDTSSDEVKLLATDARAQRMKSMTATAVSLATGMVASKAMGAAFTVRQKVLLGGPATQEVLEKASIGSLLGATQAGQKFGAIGQSIIDDVVGSVVGGGTQGVLAAQDPNEAISGLVSGILFAPIGVATGYLRGRNLIARGEVTASQKIARDAYDVAMTRQLRYAESKSINALKNDATSLIESNNLTEAVIRSRIKTKPDAVGIIRNVEDSNINLESGNIFKHKNNILFAGPDHKLTPLDIKHFEQTGVLPPTAKFAEHVGYGNQEYRVVGKTGDQYTIEHPTTGKQMSVMKGDLDIQPTKVQQVAEPRIVDKLWDDFNKFMKPGESFTTQLINFSNLKGLTDNIAPLAEAFGKKLRKMGVESLDPAEQALYHTQLSNVTKALEANKTLHASPEANAHNLVIEAESRGFYIEDDGGLINVRAIDGHDSMGRFVSTEDALEFVRGTGMDSSAPALDTTAPIPSNVGGGVANNTAAQSNVSQPWAPMEPNRWERAVSRWDMAHPEMSSAEQFFVGTDITHNTKTRLQFTTLQDASRITNAEIETARKQPKMQLLRKKLDQLSPKQRDQVTALRETASLAELEADGGIAKFYRLNPKAKQVAEWFKSNNQDYNKSLRWLREKFALENRYKSQYMGKASDMLDSVMDPTMTEDMVMGQRAQAQTIANQWHLDPEYRQELQQLKDRFGVDQKFEEGAGHIDSLFGTPTGSMDVYASSRLYRAMVDPDLAGLTKEEFIAKHKLNSTQIQAHELMAELYDTHGTRFGIDDTRFVTNFLNHYRIYGDPVDLTGLDVYTRGLADGNVRRFVSDMVRTGEILNYERDPMRALDNYVRAGIKAERLYPAIDAADEVMRQELKKVAAQDTRDAITRRYIEYTSALTGALNMDQRAAASIMMQHLKNLGLSDTQIVSKMNESSKLNTVLNWVNSSVMGGRLMMAMRDTNDAITKYFVLHGADRTKNFLKKAVTAEQLEKLKQDGIVKSTSFEEMYDPGSLNPTAANRIGSVSHKAAEMGFKLSGQGMVYERVQAAAYLENRQFIGETLGKYYRNEITKEKAYEKIFINKHDPVVAERFNQLVDEHKHEAATHFLAQEETHIVSGLFGLGNQPQGARTTFGRLYGQLGSYSIANRSFYLKIGTKGTAKEIARTLTRYAMSQSALLLTGKAAGLNLSRWAVTPLSFVFTGGPLIDLTKNAVAVGGSIGGSDQQQDYAVRQLKRQGWLAVPFGYAIRDLQRAYQLYDDDPTQNALTVTGQAFGVPPLEH